MNRKSRPHGTHSRAKSNEYPKRGRDWRQLEDEAGHGLFAAAPSAGAGYSGSFCLAGLRSLDLELVEQQRRAGDAEPDGLGAVLDRGRSSGGDEIAAQRADVEISQNSAAHQFFVRIFGLDAIEQPRLEPWSHGFHVESVGQIAILAKFDQLCFEAGVRLGIGRLQNEIAGIEAQAQQ